MNTKSKLSPIKREMKYKLTPNTNQKELVSSSKLQSVNDSEIKMQSRRHDDLQTYLHRMSGKNPKNYKE